ncbi:MAG: response regulator [Planctomycetaceae bacterium]|nr:response regulator [Planctomycetaceae bacterium]
MNETERNPADDAATLKALQKELRARDRRIEQLRRQAEQAELYALRSKQAILGTTRELEAAVARLEQATGQLREEKLRAEAANEAKSRFVATISHELRTPMNGILGTAELLMQSGIQGEERELVEVIQRSSKGLLSIINDVLDFTKGESNRIQLERIDFDLRETLRAVVELESNAARRRGITLECDVDEHLPAGLLGDPVRLRQVLLNLIDNAIKFTSEGGVRLEVRAVGDGLVEFRVRDSGIGIPASKLDSIFDPFVQADSSTTRRFGGSGLGLAICRQLVRLMGGELRVESEPGRGSTFRFTAHFASACTLPIADTFRPASEPMKLSLRVLVVDDNAVNRMIGSRLVQRMGCTCAVAEDGAAAIAAAERGGLDVILMDCSMPGIDGYQATAAIRALPPPLCNVRIIAVTAHALAGDREVCLAAGMDDYLTKPIEVEALREALARVATVGPSASSAA